MEKNKNYNYKSGSKVWFHLKFSFHINIEVWEQINCNKNQEKYAFETTYILWEKSIFFRKNKNYSRRNMKMVQSMIFLNFSIQINI